MSRVLCEPIGGNEAQTLSNAPKATSQNIIITDVLYHGLCYPYVRSIIDSPQIPPAGALPVSLSSI